MPSRSGTLSDAISAPDPQAATRTEWPSALIATVAGPSFVRVARQVVRPWWTTGPRTPLPPTRVSTPEASGVNPRSIVRLISGAGEFTSPRYRLTSVGQDADGCLRERTCRGTLATRRAIELFNHSPRATRHPRTRSTTWPPVVTFQLSQIR